MTLHVYPSKDLVEHETEGDDCICGPTPELVQAEHGDEWILIHHSLDGRERNE